MIAQSELLGKKQVQSLRESELFPEVVRRGYDRARVAQKRFGLAISESSVRLPKDSCLCINGSVSRLESVQDSDIDYVLIWNDSIQPGGVAVSNENDRLGAASSVNKLNSVLTSHNIRPCDSFSCHKPISELISTENLFSRYCILTLIDSTFAAGSKAAYDQFLKTIQERLGEYALGISAETQVIRTLIWYIQREGWVDQLHFGTSVNRFSRLIQLFTTILSIDHFGIDSTRTTKTTWVRIEKLKPFLPNEMTECLERLWVKALELKENRLESPMIKDSGFIGISKLLEIWVHLQHLAQAPIG